MFDMLDQCDMICRDMYMNKRISGQQGTRSTHFPMFTKDILQFSSFFHFNDLNSLMRDK